MNWLKVKELCNKTSKKELCIKKTNLETLSNPCNKSKKRMSEKAPKKNIEKPAEKKGNFSYKRESNIKILCYRDSIGEIAKQNLE